MRTAPLKSPRQERHQQKKRRQLEARRLQTATIDQMHDRHGWMPTGETCNACRFYAPGARLCLKFYKKEPPKKDRLTWKPSYPACGLFEKTGEDVLRTKMRQAMALPAGEYPEDRKPAVQGRLFR